MLGRQALALPVDVVATVHAVEHAREHKHQIAEPVEVLARRVFDRLLNLGQSQAAKSQQLDAKLGERLKADSGRAQTLYPKAAWWRKSPDLLLAFANVPLKENVVSSTLVAYASEGKQLRAGKRYDEEIPALRELQRQMPATQDALQKKLAQTERESLDQLLDRQLILQKSLAVPEGEAHGEEPEFLLTH